MAMFLIMFGWLLMFAALVVWALQGFAWLYYGQWITISLLDLWRQFGFQVPRFEWKELEKVVLWVMGLSPGQGLMLFGLTLTVGSNWLADQNEKAKSKSKQRHDDEKRRNARAELARHTSRSSLDTDPS